MNSRPEGAGIRPCWFVGAAFNQGTQDQVPRFLQEGIWENGYKDKYLEEVKSIQVGDRIAIKAVYTQKIGLPFNNRGHTVSVMKVKAIGEVKKNLGNGRTLKVAWEPLDPPREWYFSTGQKTVWKVLPGQNWKKDALIRFTFEGEEQDIARFCNDPEWRERFGGDNHDTSRFSWIRFYEAVAGKLLAFKDRRSELISGIHDITGQLRFISDLDDQYEEGISGPLQDICPFTTIGIFNRRHTEENRNIIANKLANLLGLNMPAPSSFEGIPIVDHQRSWFFAFHKDREPNDIDILWNFFAQAIAFAKSDNAGTRAEFLSSYDRATQVKFAKWNLTIGLHWTSPRNFASLDFTSREYIEDTLGITINGSGPRGVCNANDYLDILNTLKARFKEKDYPVHSFPELAYTAWFSRDNRASPHPNPIDPDARDEATPTPVEPYSIDDITKDGCFIAQEKLEGILKRLRDKKNLILQGPPGTGKTWLAKRLAFALMEQRDHSKIRAVQFHPNLSYEDFVRGWRPEGDGNLKLVDGPFVETIKAAGKDSSSKHVIVIEEINRGNPAQIFGEMLTLLEASKRKPSEALELSYRRPGERVFVPENLYVIGTMNIADRSLALVDLALRRRFAFVYLEPIFGKPWREWVHRKCGIDLDTLSKIEGRLTALNEQIAADPNLGPQSRVGHSYVTPSPDVRIDDGREWFCQVVDTEIGPLLDEYWFDSHEKSQQERDRLLDGF